MKTETAPSSRLEVKSGAVHEIDPGKIDRLCPELRIILDAELAAGNKVVATFEGWGSIVMLAEPFRATHDIDGTRVAFVEVNDPHYWKSQYSVKELDQHLACRF